ncbi:response regulator [Burkholderiaceae bacterium DAT-1]|nr:response regulator [Burkholderiaceae bacterium DAT-1]
MSKHLPGMHILLVEDDPFSRLVTELLLNEAGCHVQHAVHGRAAIELQSGTRFDLILMDLDLPEMNGFTATRFMRMQGEQPAIPIIALTANEKVSNREQCMLAGMDDVLIKPINIHLLDSVFGRVCAERENHQSDLAKQVPAIDRNAGLKSVDGQEEFYRRILESFRKRQTNVMGEFGAMLADGHLAEAQRIMHTLKGSGATIGASTLSKLAGDFEVAIRENWQDQFAQQLDLVSAELSRVIAEIDQTLRL